MGTQETAVANDREKRPINTKTGELGWQNQGHWGKTTQGKVCDGETRS